jgi:hypothetical protein
MCRPRRLQQYVVFENLRRFPCNATGSTAFSRALPSIAKLYFRFGWYSHWKTGAGRGMQRGGHYHGMRSSSYVEVRVPDEKVRSRFDERERECECLIILN